jgi:hypothetical protein
MASIIGYVLPYYYEYRAGGTLGVDGYKGRFTLCKECARRQANRAWLRQYNIDPDEWLENQDTLEEGARFVCKMCGGGVEGDEIFGIVLRRV